MLAGKIAIRVAWAGAKNKNENNLMNKKTQGSISKCLTDHFRICSGLWL